MTKFSSWNWIINLHLDFHVSLKISFYWTCTPLGLNSPIRTLILYWIHHSPDSLDSSFTGFTGFIIHWIHWIHHSPDSLDSPFRTLILYWIHHSPDSLDSPFIGFTSHQTQSFSVTIIRQWKTALNGKCGHTIFP